MKAITVWQPWASLLVSGRKRYETRSWATSYRGPIAIHAAKRPVRQTIDALVLTRCNLITEAFVAKLTPMELALGDFTLGRYAWDFHVRIAADSPVPAKGMQGLWEWRGSL